ncbi:hypothetical protein F4679DRAFT_589726 [Xylaria curta]|nr:hypothetical protein F4679DRAFT_589726 [Xylaria curta]
MPGPYKSYSAGVTPTNGPYHVRVNGLHGFSLAARREDGYVPVPPNDEMFTSLAVAVNIGLEMLETPSGRTALHRLGHALVQARAQRSDSALEPFTGDLNRMEEYVDHFLERVRGDYPRVTLQRFPGGVLASTDPLMPTSHLRDFRPKQAAGFAYNLEKVESMVIAYNAYTRAARGSKASVFYLERWQNFLFILACATAYELTHLFTLYLSLYSDWPPTPKEITYHGYSQGQGGESGRWLEGVLYGGSLELYNERTEGPEQPGRPYILDRHNFYHHIDPRAVVEFVTDPRQYRFPFPLGKAETRDDLRRQGLRNTGSTSEAAMPAPQSIRAMQSLSAIRKLRGYSIHIDALRQRPSRASVPLRVTAA